MIGGLSAKKLLCDLMQNLELREHIAKEATRHCGHNRENREDLIQEAWCYISAASVDLTIEGYKLLVTAAMRACYNLEKRERTDMYATFCDKGGVEWSNWNPNIQRVG